MERQRSFAKGKKTSYMRKGNMEQCTVWCTHDINEPHGYCKLTSCIRSLVEHAQRLDTG